jgi:NAD(P)-dependent dehydrogenase (short-subunit alcohol dehydrogenase family)
MASVLITGTSKGIGLETALVVARAGHKVLATMRSPDRYPELAQTAARERLPIQVFKMDVDSDESVKSTVAGIQKQFGPIDVLVNNAGIELRGAVEELNIAVFRRVMETNYFGAIRAIQAVMPQMRQRKSGCIVNITSVAGKIALAPMAAYAASKHALEALSEALAQEAKPFNVHVAIVEPGIINTAMAQTIREVSAPASSYPQERRIGGLFSAALQTPVAPTVVGQKVLEIIDSGTWKLRHPVGPDSEPFLQWRASMNDEQWVNWGAADDDIWYDSVQRDFGLNARHKVADM